MTKQELLKIVTVPTQKEIIVAKYFGIVCMCRSQLIITSRNQHLRYFNNSPATHVQHNIVGIHKQVSWKIVHYEQSLENSCEFCSFCE